VSGLQLHIGHRVPGRDFVRQRRVAQKGDAPQRW
jgi:hypothetical protein